MGIHYQFSIIISIHIAGVYSSYAIMAGISLHMLTAIFIGIVTVIFISKTGI